MYPVIHKMGLSRNYLRQLTPCLLMFLLLVCSSIQQVAAAQNSDLTKNTPKAINYNNFYLVTWDTKSITDRKAFDALLSEQAGSLLKLWKAGKIENVYIDPKPTDQTGHRVGTVAFFVRATTPETADAVLAEMPFVKKRIVNYNLKEVGAFWLGRPEDLGIGTND